MRDRIEAICDLLLGAAYADDDLHEKETETIRELLAKLLDDGELTEELASRIEGFDPDGFDHAALARSFAEESLENKHSILELIAAVHDADDEYDFAEDDYLRDVAMALGYEADEVDALTLEVEIEELRDDLERLRTPPPTPPKR